MRRAIVPALGGDVAARLLLLVATVVIAREIGAISFGRFIALSAVAALSAMGWDFGTSTLLARETARAGEHLGMYGDALRARWKALPVAVALFVGGAIAIGPAVINTEVAVFAAIAVVTGLQPIPLAVLRGKGAFARAGAAAVAGRATSVVAAVAILGAVPTLTGASFAILAGEVVTLTLAIILVGTPRRRRAAEADEISLRNAAPFAANTLLAIAYNRLDVVLLGALASPVAVAAYGPASRLQDALFVLPVSVGSVALTSFAQRLSRSIPVGAAARRLAAAAFIVASTAAAVLFATMPWVIVAVLGEEYESVVTPARILVWFLPFSVLNAVVLALLTARGESRATTRVFFTAFVTACALHLALDWWAGAVGASIASVTREPTALAAGIWSLRRVSRTRSKA